MLNTFLCDELDPSALRLVYAKWRGESVDPPQLKLALGNLVSYGLYLTPNAVFGRKAATVPAFSAPSDAEVEAGFQSLLSVADSPDAKKIGDGTFLKMILPIVLKILAGFLV